MQPTPHPPDSLLPTYEIVSLIKAELGSEVEVVNSQVIHQLTDYLVLKVQLEHPRQDCLIKLAGPLAPRQVDFARTAAILQLVSKSTPIAMPQVIAVDETMQLFPWRFMIRTYLPGVNFAQARQNMDIVQQAYALSQLGEAVAHLHQIRFPAFGQIHPDLQVTGSVNFEQALLAHADSLLPNPELRQYFQAAYDQRADLFAGSQIASLCHEDLHAYNLLYQRTHDQWRLATILDFDKAWSGGRQSDLARMDLWGLTGENFWNAYNQRHAVDETYPGRRPVFQMLWCLEYAVDSPAHLETTRRLSELLDLPIIEQFLPLRIR